MATLSVFAAGSTEETRSISDRGRRLSLDVLDYSLFLPSILLACSLGISLRLLGPLYLVIPVGFCLAYAILRRTVPPRLLSAYLAFAIFIAVLSKFRLMPTSWQTHFMEEAIVRQLIPMIGFFAAAWASKAYFRRRLACGDTFFGAPIILFLSLVVAPAVMFHQGLRYQGEDSEHAVLALYGSFINNIVIALFFITGAIFLTTDWRRYLGLATVLAIAVTTHFSQFKVLTVALLATLFGVPGRPVVIGLTAAFIGIYAVGINHIPEAMHASPNSGIRLAFVADALSSAVDTNGIGIGYGKESVKWRYHFPNMPEFTFLPDPRSITHDRMLQVLSTGVHNSFVQALLRTGVLGFLLLGAAIFAAFPPGNLPKGVRNHAAIVFGILFLNCFVNPALETPIVSLGVGYVYGYLLALRASARPQGVPRKSHLASQ
ncbi:MAG TPA: hypothetical protein VFP60_16890 [Pseudolabrys sp.]|nr:hypothetical protein [Pseudolabrys sp.]